MTQFKQYFAILLVMIISGCSLLQQAEDPYEKDQLPMAKNQEGFSLGLYDNGKIENQRSYTTNKSTFKKQVVFGNKTSEPGKFLLLIFNHGQQLNFEIDGKNVNKYLFQLEANQYEEMEVTIKGLEKGFHSIHYVIVREPYKKMKSLEETLRYSQLYTVRLNILKDIEEIPKERPTLTRLGYESKEKRIHGTLISKPDHLYHAWLNQRLDQKKTYSYQIIYGNKESRPVDLYLVKLLDWEQVAFDDKETVIYDQLQTDTDKIIDQSLDSSMIEGEQSLVILYLPEPFEPLSEEEVEHTMSPEMSNRTILSTD